MDLIERIAIGSKILAEKGGVNPSNSYHYVRLQLTAFIFYFLSPVFFGLTFYLNLKDETIILLCIPIALTTDHVSGKLIQNIDLSKNYSHESFKHCVVLVNALYVLVIITIGLFIAFIAS